jgi:creatinine amidohydrolase/Fe(II)-dependent formamide hydrolase-like protein
VNCYQWDGPSLRSLVSAALGPAHAAREETAIALAAWPASVRRDLLPPAGTPLVYRDYGIVDADAFDGRPAADFALPAENDPRSATAEEGHAILEAETAALANLVRQERAAAVR